MRKYYKPVELLDLMPTLVDLAGLPPIPICSKYTNLETCAEGKSLKHLFLEASDATLHNATVIGQNHLRYSYAFSQCPRPSQYPAIDSDEPSYNNIRYMGYTVRSKRYRYTGWVKLRADKEGN